MKKKGKWLKGLTDNYSMRSATVLLNATGDLTEDGDLKDEGLISLNLFRDWFQLE